MKNKIFHIVFILVIISQSCPADIRLPAIISDNMVLQQKTVVSLWGWADVGEKIKVNTSWDSKVFETVADSNSKWIVKIKTGQAGGSHEITIQCNNNIRVIKNVLFGEVWLCSGQSNMWMPMSGLKQQPIESGEEEIANADYPKIRLFKVKETAVASLATDCEGQWQVCSPKSVKDFSAVAYFFGKELYNELKVPIGLIHSSWGGTLAEAWTRREILENDPELKIIVEKADENLLKWEKDARKRKKEGESGSEKPWFVQKQNLPSFLYNGMISPIIPYGIKGVIWYQGESNADRAYQYRRLFPAMIENWRSDWGLGEFSFYFVQLASYIKHQPGVPLDVKRGEPVDDVWAELREAQLMTLKSVSNTGMAVAIDIGEANCIHPANKRDVGKRLSLWALANDYAKNVEFSGPIYKEMNIQGNKIRISFDHVYEGLVINGTELDGFAMAGADKRFIWANAKIDGDSVIVWNDNISNPVAVRYAWARYPLCNLYNKAGLPASPFRTDDWSGITFNNK